MNEEIRCEQWAALYADLLHAPAPFGRNDAFGDGDSWLVDDGWGGRQHKVVFLKLDVVVMVDTQRPKGPHVISLRKAGRIQV